MVPRPSLREILSLNDSNWFIGAVAPQPFGDVNDFQLVEGWLPAAVPGDIRFDLLRAGKIPDPFLGMNNEASQWIDAYDWWYRRDLVLRDEPDTRAFLIFEGVDYQSAFFWDGVPLGRHVGMFSRQVYEIPGKMCAGGKHQLAVRVWGSDQLPKYRPGALARALKRSAARLMPGLQHFPDRYASLKCQMSFGWDFAPRLRTSGIWDDVSLIRVRDVFIRDVWVQGVPDGRVRVMLDLDGKVGADARIHIAVNGKSFVGDPQQFDLPLPLQIEGKYELHLTLDTPRVWNPWDRGEPNLYELQVRVQINNEVLDSVSATFGLRMIELAPNAGARADDPPWTFVVNGKREFIRGANWVPADAIPARVTPADYADLLRLAREANINLLRVWGGGLREKKAFYDLSDEMGILVWQEFPFSGGGLDFFPRTKEYLGLVESEGSSIVRALRNHPSVAMWCTGNEFFPHENKAVIDTVRRVVAQNDGTRPFKPASPSHGESHNWRVWHGQANTRDYRDDNALFFGEFGLQALPDRSTLERFLPDSEVSVPGATWIYHNAELEKLRRYATAINLHLDSLDAFISASQQAQLRGLQVMIEHARRNKPRVSGCAFWQFNEPWYSICWSVIDYARQPKAAFEKIKELYNPVLVSFNFPLRVRRAGEIVNGQLWLINDTLNELNGTLRAWHNDTLVMEIDANAPADSARPLESLDLQLGTNANTLRFEFRAGELVSTNDYDLNYCDLGEISRQASRYARASEWLRVRT